VVGKTITNIEYGAMTGDGMSVTKIVFEGGDQVLILPQMVDEALTVETGLRAAIRFIFQPRKHRSIIMPGQFVGRK
jgi:hypothetical protein